LPPLLTLAVYCLLIVAASLAGGAIPLIIRLTHKRMELALSFISGVMLGVAALLLLPHALEARSEALGRAANAAKHGLESHALGHDLANPVMLSLLAGFLAMFLIERFFCFHHHAAPAEAPAGHDSHVDCSHDHGHRHRAADGGEQGHGSHGHALRWSGAAVGLALHSLLDGVALAASVAAAQRHSDGDAAAAGAGAGLIAGLGTFIVILLHKPFDSLTLGTLLAASGSSRTLRHAVNAAFALLVPIGAALFTLGIGSEGQPALLAYALAFAAGTFLCIALSDLLPELQFHQHDRVKLTVALGCGLALAWVIAAAEARVH